MAFARDWLVSGSVSVIASVDGVITSRGKTEGSSAICVISGPGQVSSSLNGQITIQLTAGMDLLEEQRVSTILLPSGE